MKQDIINYLKDKRILILGYGREGKSAVNFIQQNLPDAKFALADQNELAIDGVQVFCGADYLNAVKDFDIVIKSPGIPTRNFVAADQIQKVTSLTDLFLRFCRNTIIGITGTKGKSTTASLTHHILKTAGKNTILVGNIGIPCFDALEQIQDETIIVYEISCHQLEFVKASPKIAILLNLYEEHFDHYAKPEDYFVAKKNIFRFQTANDTLIYGDIFQHASHEEIDSLPMRKIDIYHDISIPREQIHTHLVGEHNLYDIYAAISACKAAGLTLEEILPTIESFRGLPHRMEYVGEYHGIKFYNDSIATAQEAVINAVKALKDVDTLILGGMDRGLNYQPLVDFLCKSQVSNVILLPNTEQSFQKLFDKTPHALKITHAANMADAVDVAYEVTAKNHICLLSPAAASYGFYKNFEERGTDFCNLVKNYNKI